MKKLHGTYSIQPLTITNAVIAEDAAIDESKLNLSYNTASIQSDINDITVRVNAHTNLDHDPHGTTLYQTTLETENIQSSPSPSQRTITVSNPDDGDVLLSVEGDIAAVNASFSGDTTIAGITTIGGQTHITGNVVIDGNLSVSGETTTVESSIIDYDSLLVTPSSALNRTGIIVAPDDTGVIHPEPEVIKRLKLDMPYIGASAKLSDGSVVLCGSGDYGDDSRIVVLSPDLTELKSSFTRGIPGMGLDVFNIADPSVAVDSNDSIFVVGRSKRSDGTYDSILLKLSSTLGLIGVMKLGVNVSKWDSYYMCVSGDHVLVAIGDDYTIKRYSTASISYEDTIEGFTDPERGFVSFYDSNLYMYAITVDPYGNIWMSGYDSDLGGNFFHVLDPDFNLVDTYVVDYSYKGDNITDEWFLYYSYEDVNHCTFSPDGRFLYMACFEYIAKYSLEDRKIVGAFRPCMTGYEDYPDNFDYGFGEYYTVEVLDSGDLIIPEFQDINNIYVVSNNLEDVVYLEGEASQTDYSVVFKKNIGIAEAVTEEEWEADGPWLDDIVNTVIEPEGDTFTGNLLELQKRTNGLNEAAVIVDKSGTLKLLTGGLEVGSVKGAVNDNVLVFDKGLAASLVKSTDNGFVYRPSSDNQPNNKALDIQDASGASNAFITKNGDATVNSLTIGGSNAITEADGGLLVSNDVKMESSKLSLDNSILIFSAENKDAWSVLNRNSSVSFYFDTDVVPQMELSDGLLDLSNCDLTKTDDLEVMGSALFRGSVSMAANTTVDGIRVGSHDHTGGEMGSILPQTAVSGLKTFVDNINSTIKNCVNEMTTGNTESGIDVAYNSNTGKLNFSVNNFTITLSGNASGSATIQHASNTTLSVTVLDSAKLGGLSLASSTANADANRVLRTDANGKTSVKALFMSSPTDAGTGTIGKIYASVNNETEVKTYTPANFATQILALGGTTKNSHTHTAVNGLTPVRGSSTFNGVSGRVIMLSSSRANTNYSVTVTPSAAPNGTLGEIWVIKGTDRFTVYNSGIATTAFDYILLG